MTHSRERASHPLQKELPQKEACIDKGRGPQRQEGAFERFQILESGNSSSGGNDSNDFQAAVDSDGGWKLTAIPVRWRPGGTELSLLFCFSEHLLHNKLKYTRSLLFFFLHYHLPFEGGNSKRTEVL